MKPNVKPLAIVMISIFGFLIIVSHYSRESQLVLTGQEMQMKVLANNYVVDRAGLLSMSDATIIYISVNRSGQKDSLPNWHNIPLSSILADEHVTLLSQKSGKVIMADDAVKAHEAWMLLTQMGYEELYVFDTATQRQ
jgi:hypothetical protein